MIIITRPEGALLIFLQSGDEKFIAWLATLDLHLLLWFHLLNIKNQIYTFLKPN